MANLSAEQSAQVGNVVATTSEYVKQLNDALNAAFHTNKDELASQLLTKLQDAINLKAAAVDLQNITTLDALKPAVINFQTTAKKLSDQKVQIDAIVNAVGTIATVISTINQIAASVAKLVTML
jgi:hypothetical protein